MIKWFDKQHNLGLGQITTTTQTGASCQSHLSFPLAPFIMGLILNSGLILKYPSMFTACSLSPEEKKGERINRGST